METHVGKQRFISLHIFTPYFHCIPPSPFIYFSPLQTPFFQQWKCKHNIIVTQDPLYIKNWSRFCSRKKNMTCYKNTVYGAWSSQQPQTCTHKSQENQLGRAFPSCFSFVWPLQTLKGQKVGISSLSHPCSTCRFPSPKKPPEEGKKTQCLHKVFSNWQLPVKSSEMSFPSGHSQR